MAETASRAASRTIFIPINVNLLNKHVHFHQAHLKDFNLCITHILFIFPPSEPCNPTSISSTMDCLSNIAVVTWAVSEGGAEYYTTTVEHEDGQSKSCMSSSFQCGMPDLRCGQNYTVTVTASNQHCHSDPSVVNTLTTGETDHRTL